MEISNEQLVVQAREGNLAALETLIGRVQSLIYNLALRTLGQPADAEDASQEILLRIVTHLSQFRQESLFTTWVYRIATNYLLTTRKRRAELQALSWEADPAYYETKLPAVRAETVEQRMRVEEIRLRCTLGMLLTLDREHRLAYILGEGFEVSSEEGAYIMEVSPATFRKRLSRARLRLRDFMDDKCEQVNPNVECICLKKHNIRSCQPENQPDLQHQLSDLEKLGRVAAIFRQHPTFAAPDNFRQAIKQLLESRKFEWFS